MGNMCPDSCLSRSDAAEDKEPVGQQQEAETAEQQQSPAPETKAEGEGSGDDGGQKEEGGAQDETSKE